MASRRHSPLQTIPTTTTDEEEDIPYSQKCLRLDGPVPMALAWDMMARASIGMSSVYLGPALLDLGQNVRIWGTDPGSLLTNLAAVSGFLGCIALPLAGSVLDHTEFRQTMGQWSAISLVLLKIVEMFLLQESTWIWILPLQVILAVAFNIHVMATYAYLSELSSDPSVQAEYNSTLGVILYLSSLVLLGGVLLGSSILNTDDSGTARLALGLASIACTVGFGAAWNTHGFPERPALHEISRNQSIWTAGLSKLVSTLRSMRIQHTTTPVLYVLAATAFGEAGSAALVSVSTTYMKRMLEMSAQEIGTVFLAFLLAGVPGNKLGEFVTAQSKSPTFSAMVCNLCFISATVGAALLLRGPDQKSYTAIFGVCWGGCMGWLHPAHNSAFVPLVPPGCHAEWMGIYILATVLLTWLPSAVFSLLNEMGYPMDVGLMSLNLFFAMEILCLRQVGDFADAMARSKSTQPTMEMHELT